ncbi:hypothetical protein [Bradyrhizobium sp. McL0616]|uniref:hypothetical protein n=1 Tax=Bradyrhizobium sp. McL0616 TaxID=3415674 RepID=UPI003CF9157F
MAETNKLSVEKALEKLRQNDQLGSAKELRDEKSEALNREIKRMRAQRMRLDQKPSN